MTVISALGILRPEDGYKFEATLGFVVSSKSTSTKEQDPFSKNGPGRNVAQLVECCRPWVQSLVPQKPGRVVHL